MSEHIDRQKAIDALADYIHNVDKVLGTGLLTAEDCMDAARSVLGEDELPSAEEESFEWCDTCKEYDQESHCCHRWTKVIRNTVEELRVVKCKDCENYQTDWEPESAYETHYCAMIDTFMPPYGFCSYAERREVTE